MVEQMRADEQKRRVSNRPAPISPAASSSPGREQEGCWAYLQRQLQERIENLGLMGYSIDKLEDNSSGWANDVNKYVGSQKKVAVMGSKFYTSIYLFLYLITLICHSSDWKQIRILNLFGNLCI